MKNPPNHRRVGGGHLKNSKKFQKSKCTHVPSIYVIMYIFQDLKPKTGTLAQDFSHFQNVLEKPTYGVLRFQIQNLEHTLRC